MKHLGDITKPGEYKVYRYTFPSGKVYIGVTKNPIEVRRDQGYQHNKELQRAIRQVGWQGLKVDILENNLDNETAYERERYYISVFHSDDPNKGFNISKGGKATFEGLHHTEDHKKYMSNILKGRPFSSEHRNHLREAQKKTPVVRIDTNGTKTNYTSLHEAATSVNGHPTNVSRACKSGRLYKSYSWAFAEGR